MNPLTVSVIIPAYNEQDRIGRTLECLIEQIDEIDEIIVVDNRSTDATAEVVSEIRLREPKVRIVSEDRPGVFYARQAGFDAATSTVIARLDADTYARPGWARALREFFESAPSNVGAVTGPLVPYDSPYRAKFESGKIQEIEAGLAKHNPGGRAVYDIQMAPGGNMAISRECWLAIRDGLSERTDIYDDLDLSICVRKAGFAIGLSADMWAETSARRFRTSPFSYWSYMAQLPRTYRAHGDKKQAWASYGVVWNNRLLHLWTWLPARAFDMDTGKKSFKQLFRREEDRIVGRAK
ncbi:glycosyltransferase family 2 protein [Speluncibacter jeojiensis]|uniref:Glycosyltransferase n=1 Tax=Speluncibacter jeojiensis TaxID=2710754 RepID=A0A9X4M264_9ACTN|nr:glycosyltransferase [Corynebacteriales bacterium D3-21]